LRLNNGVWERKIERENGMVDLTSSRRKKWYL
jgi:hypothetical protein